LHRTIIINNDHHVVVENGINTKHCVDAALPHAAMRRELDDACCEGDFCSTLEQSRNVPALLCRTVDGCLDPCLTAR
jgi:hypothetical protein